MPWVIFGLIGAAVLVFATKSALLGGANGPPAGASYPPILAQTGDTGKTFSLRLGQTLRILLPPLQGGQSYTLHSAGKGYVGKLREEGGAGGYMITLQAVRVADGPPEDVWVGLMSGTATVATFQYYVTVTP